MTQERNHKPRFRLLLGGVAALCLIAWSTAVLLDTQASVPPNQTVITLSGYNGTISDWVAEMEYADLVVEGTVQEVLAAQWATPQKNAPATQDELKNPAVQIRTPVALLVERAYKGKVGAEVVFSFVGGTIETTTMTAEGTEGIKPGAKLIIFLQQGASDNPATIVHPDGLFPSTLVWVENDIAYSATFNVPVAEIHKQLEGAQQ